MNSHRFELTSLLFPTYNPGDDLERTWPEVRRFLHEAPGTWEVLYICDGCTDGSPERLARLTANEPRVRIVSHAPNRGKGYAVRQGLEAARGRHRIFTDVDLSYGLDGVLRVAMQLRGGADVVIGSRTHPEASFLVPTHLQDYAFWRRIQSSCFRLLASRLLPLPYGDTQGGLKGFSERALDAILPLLRCDGFAIDCEILSACEHCRLSVVEVPVCFHYRDTTTVNLKKTLRMVRDLRSIRRQFRALPSFSAAVPMQPRRAA
ncbi:MAG: glycosyltransferase family 2 protein [Planctomycetia bacterium]|nr:glycosyltransferase family 2 protein [Planctomycetia bacterium]